jgi:hypothetical protein
VLSCVIFVITAHTQWYYTRRVRNDEHPNGIQLFEGTSFHYGQLFDDSLDKTFVLYGGGMILVKETESDAVFNNDTVYYLVTNTTLIAKADSNRILNISAVQYNLFVINDYVKVPNAQNVSELSIMEEEIGLFDHEKGNYIDKKWRFLRLGMLLAAKVNLSNSVTGNTTDETHSVVTTIDMLGKPTILFHSWNLETDRRDNQRQMSSPAIPAVQQIDGSFSPPSLSAEDDVSTRRLRIMTYNLWHNNPPSWIYSVRK